MILKHIRFLKRRLMTCSKAHVRVTLLIKVWLVYLQFDSVQALSLPRKSFRRNDTLPPWLCRASGHHAVLPMFLVNVTSREAILHQVFTKVLYCSLKIQSHCLVVREFVQCLTGALNWRHAKIDKWRDKSKQSKVLQFKPNIFQKTSKKPPVRLAEWLRSECCMRNKLVLFHLGFSRQCGRLKQATGVCLNPASVNSHQSQVFWTKQPLSLEHHSTCTYTLCSREELHIRE